MSTTHLFFFFRKLGSAPVVVTPKTDFGRPVPRLVYRNWEEAAMHLSRLIQNIMNGQLNNYGDVTLTLNSTTTVISDRRLSANSNVHLVPLDQLAASESVNWYQSAAGKGTATITHLSAGTTRTFRYLIFG